MNNNISNNMIIISSLIDEKYSEHSEHEFNNSLVSVECRKPHNKHTKMKFVSGKSRNKTRPSKPDGKKNIIYQLKKKKKYI